MLDLSEIRARVSRYSPATIQRPSSARHRASVAMIFAGPRTDLRVCFIERARREGDRWSGQMAFPGGHADHDDESGTTAAERETLEEVGITIRPEDRLGALDPVPLRRTGAPTESVLFPYAYAIGNRLPPLRPQPSEVANAQWIELSHLFDPANRTAIEWPMPDGTRREFPGIAHRGRVIWGLTYRVLGHFAEVVELPALPPAW